MIGWWRYILEVRGERPPELEKKKKLPLPKFPRYIFKNPFLFNNMDKSLRLLAIKAGWHIHKEKIKKPKKIKIKKVRIKKVPVPKPPKLTKKADPRLPLFFEYYLDPSSPSFLKEWQSRARAGYRHSGYNKKYGNTKPQNRI